MTFTGSPVCFSFLKLLAIPLEISSAGSSYDTARNYQILARPRRSLFSSAQKFDTAIVGQSMRTYDSGIKKRVVKVSL